MGLAAWEPTGFRPICQQDERQIPCASGVLFYMSRRSFPFVRRQSLARHPSAFLLAAQLLSLVLYAAFDDAQSGRILLSAFGVLVLVLAVWVVNRIPAINWITWLLAAPAAVLSLLGQFLSPTLVVWGALFEAA